MQELVPQRDLALETEMAKQQTNERLRQQFAGLANHFGPMLERALDAFFNAQVGDTKQQPLEPQLKNFQRMDEEVAKFKPLLNDLERCNKVMLSTGI